MILSHVKFDFEGKCLVEKITIRAPFRFATALQDEACFIYFLEGESTVNSPHEQRHVGGGDSLLLKCGSYFSDLLQYKEADKYDILVFHLYPEILRKVYANEIPAFVKPSAKKSFIQPIASRQVIKKFIENLCFYFENPALVNDELLKLKIKELVLLLVQTGDTQSVTILFADLFTPRTVSVKEIVNNHLFSDIAISDLATLANMSLSTFNRSFQSLYNDTPANYIKMQRLEKAKKLLHIHSLSVADVAFQTCFKDVAHFSRSFKAAYHCTPSQFRGLLNK